MRTAIARLGIWLFVLGLYTGVAHARPLDEPRSVVLLPSRAELHPALPALLEAARSQLAELNVDLLLAPAPPSAELAAATTSARELARSAHAVGVIWLVPDADGLTLYLYEPSGPHLLMRRLALSASEAAAAEELAVVLRSAVSAVLDGVEVAMTEVELPESEPPHPPPPRVEPGAGETPHRPSRSRPTLSGSVGYAGTALARAAPWQSGAKLGLSLAPRPLPWTFGVAYGFWPAFSVEEPGVALRFRRHSGELVVGFRVGSGIVALEPQLALGAEVVRRTTERADSPLAPGAPSARWLWAAGTRLRGELSLGAGVRLFSTLSADFLLNRYELVVSSPETDRTVISWFRARPGVEAGLAVGAW